MNFIPVAVFYMCVGIVYGQSSLCQTPDGKSGECISLYNCQPLIDLVKMKNLTEPVKKLLQKSQCGTLDGIQKVCCPKQLESGSLNRFCNTRDGKPGKCINLHSCPQALNKLKPPVSEENIAYLRKSRCQSPDRYSVCCELTSDLDTSCQAKMSAFPPDPSTECCGINSSAGNKIVYGGIAAEIDEHPWVALIEYENEGGGTSLSCGGVLISGKYILTAGHCIAGAILKTQKPKAVRLGEYDITHEGPDCVLVSNNEQDCTDGVTKIAIEKIIPHPMYNPVDPWKRNDIALIRMKDTAPYTDFIRPICLPTKDLTQPQNTPPNFSMYAVGWGATWIRSYSNVKMHVDLPFVSLEKCQLAYSTRDRNITLWKNQLCAGGKEGMDSCKGDSGGPLMYENGKTSELIGTVSFGSVPCGLQNVPGVYSNVYEYLDWIKSTIVP